MPDTHLDHETKAGQRVAAGILERHPKLKVAFLSGKAFEKVGGIEVLGAGTPTPEVGFILPIEEWNCLTKAEQVSLSHYVEVSTRVQEARVIGVRQSGADPPSVGLIPRTLRMSAW